jgi:L,D-transpeptidase ErfK/SrfK
MRIFVITLSVILVLTSDIYASGAFPLYDDSTILIGSNTTYTIKNKETLIELARKYDVGYNEIVDANSHSDPWIPENNTGILIPTSWLLPEVLDDGIIINLAEMRLYYFFSVKGLKYVSTYPIGIGVQGFNTPTGKFRITKKIKSPVWYVPDIIREENPELPAFVPDGPDNPLGGYWLQLSVSGYGIHGTNRPYGIGRKISHGCIRLYPEDITTLFKFIKPGTTVRIINEPVKAGMYGNKIYIEIHRSERKDSELLRLSVKKLGRKRLLKYVDTQLMIQAVKNATGLPAVISK